MATSESFKTRIRVPGSGLTIFSFGGQPITFCQQVSITSPRPVGQGMAAIHPMDEPYPVQIVTPVAVGAGQIVLNMFELFGSGGAASKIWDRLGASVPGSSPATPFGAFSSANPTGTSSTQIQTGGDGIFNGAVDYVDIAIRQAKVEPGKMNIVKYIRPLGAGGDAQTYTEEYHGCVITDVVDGEQVEVGTLEILKQITVAYRYATRNGKASAGFALRDGQTV